MRLNTRPRKTLGFQTPADTFERTVALTGSTHHGFFNRKGKSSKPLTEQAKKSNRTKSAARVRAEDIFGAQANGMGGTLVRTIGMVSAKAKIGMKNLAYNTRRLGQLRRLNPFSE